jgi:hypothetical protein
MSPDDLSGFDVVVFGDSEFRITLGDRPDPVCACATFLHSDEQIRVRRDQFGAASPYPVGKNDLFIAFAAAAELGVHLKQGWALPHNIIDLRVEHIRQNNAASQKKRKRREAKTVEKVKKKQPRALLDVLEHYGIPGGDAIQKQVMRDRIIEGPPFTETEWKAILDYCISDTTCLRPLLFKLLPGMGTLDRALHRGAYVRLTAEVEDRGIQFDPRVMGHLRQNQVREALRLRIVSDRDLTHGLYDGAHLTQLRLQEFILRHKLRWSKTATGLWSTSNAVFERLAARDPKKRFDGLAEAQKTVKLLKDFALAAGADNRSRNAIWAFSTTTSRSAPGGGYPFITPAWTRNVMMPAPGMAVAYADFSSMEFAVAAALAQDPVMMRDYEETDPYLGLGVLAQIAPQGATKATHPDLREKLKAPVLSLQYGGAAGLMAHKLGVDKVAARRIVDVHHSRYWRYWEWSDRQIELALARGELIARDDWRTKVSSRSNLFSMRNWLVQANSAAIFRTAGLFAQRLGIAITAVVHDALLFESTEDRIEAEAARARLCLERAAALYLGGFKWRVDIKILRAGERFEDKRGARIWSYVHRTLLELEGSQHHAETDAA